MKTKEELIQQNSELQQELRLVHSKIENQNRKLIEVNEELKKAREGERRVLLNIIGNFMATEHTTTMSDGRTEKFKGVPNLDQNKEKFSAQEFFRN